MEKEKGKKKKVLYSLKRNPKNYVFSLYIFLTLTTCLFIKEDIFLENKISEINLKIKGNGFQKIIKIKDVQNPDEFYLNEKKLTQINSIGSYKAINIEGEENNNIKIVWNNFNGKLFQAFKYLSNITEIDLSKFNASPTDIADLFWGCTSLISVNLKNFDTSQNTNFGHTFTDCISLTSIDLSSLNTSLVTHMDFMFFNCTSLKTLNLSHFDTSRLIRLDNMFANCGALTSLNLSNFKISRNVNITNMFINCKNLQYLNIWNAKIEGDLNHVVIQKIISNTANNLILCINTTNQPGIFDFLNETAKNCLTLGCPENLLQQRIVFPNGSCILNEINEDKETTTLPEAINNTCLVEDFFLGKCTNIGDKDLFKRNILSAIKDGSLNNLINSKVNNNNSLMVDNNEEVYLITTLDNQIYMGNLTSINFSECEAILKEDSINNEELYIFRIDHIINGYNVPIIEYVIFNKNKTFLNLDKCNNINSKYSIPVNINESDLFKYNPSSDYYNDECNKYTSENGLDMTLYDRKYDYNKNNLSLCQANCTFIRYNSSTSKAECDCKIKLYNYTSEELSKDDLLNKIENEKKVTNLNLMKCSNLISSTENIKTNSGFYSIAIIIVLFIIIMIIFCFKGYKSLKDKIDEIISKKFKPQKNPNKSKTLMQEMSSDKNKKRNNLERKNKKLNTSSKGTKNNFIVKKDNKTKRSNNSRLTTQEKKNENIKDDDFMKYTNDYELNNLSHELALKYDKRQFCDYYFSLIRTKELLFFSFCTFNDYNSGIIKKFIFFLSFALHYTISALFFTDETMHQIYQDKGKYNIIYQFPFITYSAIISTVILRIILSTLVLTEKSILEVKNQKSKILAEKKKKEVLKYMIIKFSIFFVLNLFLLIVFWYYLTCFNALYQNTQIDLIINSLISFGLSLVYPFVINIIPGFFRMDSLDGNKRDKKKNKKNIKEEYDKNSEKETEYVYKISQLLQIL